MSDQAEDIAKALCNLKHPGRNWDTDFTEAAKAEFHEMAAAVLTALKPAPKDDPHTEKAAAAPAKVEHPPQHKRGLFTTSKHR